MAQAAPPELDPQHRPDLKAAIEAMPASRLLGLRVAGFDAAGVSRIELPIRPELSFDVAPAAGERLVAIGRALSLGKSSAVSRAEVLALRDGRWTPVCVATTTCRSFEFLRA